MRQYGDTLTTHDTPDCIPGWIRMQLLQVRESLNRLGYQEDDLDYEWRIQWTATVKPSTQRPNAASVSAPDATPQRTRENT